MPLDKALIICIIRLVMTKDKQAFAGEAKQRIVRKRITYENNHNYSFS
jgi:hypothetical protein